MSNRYKSSEAMLERALRTVPLGSQTFSKSKTQFPFGVSPYFAHHAKGAVITDLDGNEYVDFMCSLMAITLGYSHTEINAAVAEQLERGTIFSMATDLEVKVSEKICEMVPCAEMVRFGKNGSDATSGAIRVARAYTGKDHVFVCGYHGWQDWYIGVTTRNKGVPKATRDLSHIFNYNDIGSLEKLFEEFKGEVAAVILEPFNVAPPEDNFLQKVKDLTHANNAVLIFDETITGFRTAKGGAQEYYGVTPDLATFGKGLANGFPLSAVAGKREIMMQMEDIFYSFTFGGETLSLAASLATLEILDREPVVETLFKRGTDLLERLDSKIKEYDLGDIISLKGLPIWSFVMFADSKVATMWELKSLLMQEMFELGIMNIGSHGIMYAHTDAHINKLMEAYDVLFSKIKQIKGGKPVSDFLRCEPIVPLFKVR